MKVLTVLTALLLFLFGYHQQQNNQEPDLSAKKVAGISINYSKEHRLGQILITDVDDQIDQYFDIWAKSVEDFSPIVVTYVFEKHDGSGRKFHTATWGRGPVERNAFYASCLTTVPDFKDDAYWAAKVIDGKVEFELLEDSALKEGVIKVLFRSVKGSVQRVIMQSGRPVVSNAPHDNQRILGDLVNKKENRITWYTKGWLRPENRCVRYIQYKK